MTILNPPQTIKTLGTITFSTCGENNQPLFRINPEIPIESALEQASNLLACVSEITSTQHWAMQENRAFGRLII